MFAWRSEIPSPRHRAAAQRRRTVPWIVFNAEGALILCHVGLAARGADRRGLH